MTVTVRPAGPGDERRLLDWRNAPEVRAASFTSDEIDPVGHGRWFRAALADPEREIWIVEADGASVGTVRLSREDDGSAEIHILLASEGRGRGLARPGLEAALAASHLAPSGWRARAKRSNGASLALFRAAGFSETGRDDPAVFERKP